MTLIHLVEMRGGSLRPVCGVGHESGDWTTRDDVVTCPLCQAFAAEAVALDGPRAGAADDERDAEGSWPRRKAQC